MSQTPKLPTIKELSDLIKSIKPEICDEYKDEEDQLPRIDLTCGINETGEWSYQTGDNSYSGSAYFYPHWAVVSIFRRSNSRELAKEIREQWLDLLASAPSQPRY
jgi:DNA-directed RNA polymerase subunit H (RpoH/RPB5)